MLTLNIECAPVEAVIAEKARLYGTSPEALLVELFVVNALGVSNFKYPTNSGQQSKN